MPSACSIPFVWHLLTLAVLALAGCDHPSHDLDPGQAGVENIHAGTFASSAAKAADDAGDDEDSGAEDDEDANDTPTRQLVGLTTAIAPGRLSGAIRDSVINQVREVLARLVSGNWPRDPIAEQMCPDCILVFPDEEEPIIQPRFRVDEVPPALEPMFPGGLAVVCPDCVDVEIQIDAPGHLGTLTDVDRVSIPAGSFHPRRWSITVDGHLRITLVLPSADMAPPAKARLALDLVTADPWGNPASHTITDVLWQPVSVEAAEPFPVHVPD